MIFFHRFYQKIKKKIAFRTFNHEDFVAKILINFGFQFFHF